MNKSKEDTNADIGLQQRNTIFQVWKDLKDSIFNVLFVLLDKNQQESQQTMVGLVFQSGLDYLQMMVFPFNVAVLSVWNGGDTLTNITNVMTKLNIATYLPGVSFGTFLILVYVLIFVIIMVILDIIYVSYSFSKKKFRFTWPLVLLAQIVPLFVTVFFIPITQTLFSVVQCTGSNSLGKQVMASFPDVVCWQGWHLFHSVITLLFTSIFVFISSIVGLALFEPRMTTNKLAARQNSTAQVVFIINKIVTQFVFSFTPFDGTWIYCLMLFALSGWLFWTINIKQPFYNKNVSKFFRIVSTYYFWTNFMLMISQILYSTGFSGGLVIWLSGLPFLWIIIVFDKQSNIDKLFTSNLKFRTGEDLEAHLKYVLQLIQYHQNDKNSYMLLIGYIQKHKEICTEQDCPLKFTKKKKQTMEMEQNCIQLIKQLERMYKIGIKKYPTCTKLRLSFAFFHLQRTKNKKKAYEELSNAQKTDPAFEEQFIIYRFKKIIRQNLQDNQENNSDLIEIIRFDNHISLCQEAMLFSSRLHKEFWLELKQEFPDLKKLNSIGSKITQTVNTVRQNYQQIQKINSLVPQILHNYALYLILILQDSNEGKQLLNSARKINQQRNIGKEQNSQLDINGDFSQGNVGAVIVVSAKEENIGKILKTNLMFMELSGYQQQELCDRNLDKILPEIYIGGHDESMRQWLIQQDTSSTYLSSSNQGFLRHKTGFIIPVSYRIAYHHQEQQFIGIFKLDSSRTQHCHILTDLYGSIKDTTNLAYTYFGIGSNSLDNTQQLNITDIGLESYKRHLTSKNQYDVVELGTKKKLSYNLKATSIKVKSNQPDSESEDQEKSFVFKGRRNIGYCFSIWKTGKDKKTIIQQDKSQDEVICQDKVMDLYNQPNLMDIFVMELTVTKNKQATNFINYAQKLKIKTMRLMDNQIKMVYNQNSDQYYDQDTHQINEDQYELLRLDDQNYQSKIKKAINTNLNHQEVRRLRWIAFIFNIILLGLCTTHLFFTIPQLNKITIFSQQIGRISSETDFLTRLLSATFLPANGKNYSTEIANHKITLNSNINVSLVLEDNSIISKNLRDAIIFIEGRLMEYFVTKNPATVLNSYLNFINSIYPALNQQKKDISLDLTYSYSILASSFLLGVTIMCLWSYTLLLIQKKKFDIMIWFLDIPIPYVSFLGNHCDKYLKTFIGIKELMEKGLNLDQKQYYFEEYSDKKDQNEQQLQEQQKARKTLISRYKKQTILSKINLGYIKMGWIVIYTCIFSLLVVLTSWNIVSTFNFLQPQWIITTRQLLWGSSLQLSFQINKTQSNLGSTFMPTFINSIKQNYLNIITSNYLRNFNDEIVDFSDTGISKSYSDSYFGDLCKLSTSTSQCNNLLDGKLSGGYLIYATYLYTADPSKSAQIRRANQNVVSPALLAMLDVWKQSISNSVSKIISLSSIILYLYIILSLLSNITLFNLYLRSLNTELNQTIQMLNMIPLKLLPKSRKQTRQFIAWIIRQANKKQHQKQ